MMVVAIIIDTTYLFTLDMHYLVYAEVIAIAAFLSKNIFGDTSHLLAHIILTCTHVSMIISFDKSCYGSTTTLLDRWTI